VQEREREKEREEDSLMGCLLFGEPSDWGSVGGGEMESDCLEGSGLPFRGMKLPCN